MNFFLRRYAQYALASVLCSSAPVPQRKHAYPVDTTFGNHGMVKTVLDAHSGSYNQYIPDMHGTVQPDGKIVVVGNYYKANPREAYHPQSRIMVARYNPDGSPDTSFGDYGSSVLRVAQRNSFGIDVAVQKTGKIVVAGRRFDRGDFLGEAILVRMNCDGTLDASFGTGGVAALLSPGLFYANFFRMKLRGDDTIVTCGNVGSYRLLSKITTHREELFSQNYAFERAGFCVAQFSADGAPDVRFGNQGVIVSYLYDKARAKPRVLGKEDDNAHSLCIQPDGKIVVVGGMADGADSDLLLGEEPVMSPETGLLEYNPTIISHTTDCAVVRYDSTGKLDTTFGSHHTGMVCTPVSEKYNAYLDCTLQPDNKIVALGIVRSATRNSDQFLLVRYLPNGTLDHTFGNKGIVATLVGTGQARPKNIIVQPDGKILATGVMKWGKYSKFTLVRYHSDGSLDTEFGENGCMVIPIGLYDDRSLALIPHKSGILVAGDSYDGTKHNMTLVRLCTQ